MRPLRDLLAAKPVILFDLFHTLTSVETAFPDYAGTSTLLGVDAATWSDHQLNRSRDRLTGRITDHVEIVRALAHAIDPSLPEPVIRRAAEARREAFSRAMTRVPEGTVDALKALKAAGKRLGLVSNADASEVVDWGRSPLAPLFDAAVFSCVAGVPKPEPEIYLACVRELGVRPEDCCFVGDGGSDELAGAGRLGITAVQYLGLVRRISPGRAQRKPGAAYVIEDFAELL